MTDRLSGSDRSQACIYEDNGVLIDISDMILNEGKYAEYEICLESKEINVNGTDCNVVSAPVFILTLQNQAGVRLDMSGRGNVTLSVPCDRCLEPVEISVDVEIDEQIAIENAALSGEEIPVFVSGNTMDTETAVMESIFSNYPAKILCSEDCKGLCLKCGKNLNEGECGCDRFVPDPRMAALGELFGKFDK